MTALALALPAPAAAGQAGTVVPPENSAATQYTEALPTAGGGREAGSGGKKQAPSKVLGKHNAQKLESHGKQGKEVAAVVAETAPPTSPPEAAPAPAPEPQPKHSSNGNRNQGNGSGNSKAAHHAKPQHEPSQQQPAPAPASVPQTTYADLPSGSSGLGEVLGEATGSSSSGQLGILLPLAIVAAIVWAGAYFFRQRRPTG